MTPEDKNLLLQDISARLPHGVIVHCIYESGEPCYGKLTPLDIEWFLNSKIKTIKPYLRPMSSMTEEEYEELWRICDFRATSDDYDYFDRYGIQIIQEINNNKGNHQKLSIDFLDYEALTYFLNSHHFDYRGLIEKGLALPALKGMYKFE